MDRRKWLESPSRNLVDGLLSAGLITPNTPIIDLTEESPKPVARRRGASPPHRRHDNNRNRTEAPKSNNTTVFIPKHPKSPHRRPRTAIGSPSVSQRDPGEVPESFSVPATPAISRQDSFIDDRTSVSRKTSPTHERNISRSASPTHTPPGLAVDVLMSTRPRLSGKREALSLRHAYHEGMNELAQELAIEQDPIERGKLTTKQMDLAFLAWNTIIVDVRGYSEHHAALLLEIKSFVKEKMRKFPEMLAQVDWAVKQTKNELEEQVSESKALAEKLKEKEKQLQETEAKLEQSQATVNGLEAHVADLTDKFNAAVYSKDNLDNDLGNMKFRCRKLEEEKRRLQDQMKTNEEILETVRSHEAQQQELITKYEQEGAGFRPMYIKASEELIQRNDEIERLREEMKDMVVRQVVTTAEVQTDPVKIVEIKTKSKKRVKKSGRSAREEPTTQLEEPAKPRKADARRLRRRLSRVNSSSSCDSLLSVGSYASDIMDSSARILDMHPMVTEMGISTADEGSGEATTPFVATDVEAASSEPQEEEPAQPKEEEEEEPFHFEQTGEPLPEDYHIDHQFFVNAPSLMSCVFRLLPQPITTESQNVMDNIEGLFRPKAYSWLLRKIVDFFRSVLNMDQMSNAESDTVKMLQNEIIHTCGIPSIADRMFRDMLQTSFMFRTESDCVELFMKFVERELSTVEYKFFNMLFNLAFEYVYPPVRTLIEDPDVTPTTPQFLIHIDLCKQIIPLLFTHLAPDAFNFDILRKKTKITVHPDLVSFWAFAEAAIGVFRNTHVQFHKQVRALILLIGWRLHQPVTEAFFRDFFIVINPSITDERLTKYYNRFMLDESMKTEVRDNHATFINFCADFPEIASEILSLNYDPNFEKKYIEMSAPMKDVTTFVKGRFTHFVRKLRDTLPEDLKVETLKACSQMRNALLRCDTSTAVSCYRRILQLIDLKLTEESPFIVISQNLSVEDGSTIIEMIKVREALALQHVQKPQ